MATRPASSTPRPSRQSPVALDLDTLEREDSYTPFVISVGGSRITLTDPADLDWQVGAQLSEDRPFQFFEAVVPKDEQDDFFKAQVPTWKMQKMMDDYRKHYGLLSPGNSRG